MKINFKNVATALRIAAEASLAEKRVYYNGDDERDMVEMFEGDRNDTLVVANLIEAGKTDEANVAMLELDTASRDLIGESLAVDNPAYYEKYLVPCGWVNLETMRQMLT